MITDIIKTAAAVADLLREEPRIALELKNHFDGEEDLLEALGLSKYAEQRRRQAPQVPRRIGNR